MLSNCNSTTTVSSHVSVSLAVTRSLVCCILFGTTHKPPSLLKCCSHKSIVDILPDGQPESLRRERKREGDEAGTEANGSQGSFIIITWLRLQEQEGIIATSDYTEQRKQKLLCVWKGSNMRTVDAVCKQTSACLHFFLSGPYEAKSAQIYWRAALNVQKKAPQLSPARQSCLLSRVMWLFCRDFTAIMETQLGLFWM